MKIIFLCGSFENGKDGVGDYCRKLSIELKKSGHEPMIVALKDSFVSEVKKEETEYFKAIRIPNNTTIPKQKAFIRKEITAFNPDHISIQLVPYAFNARGILASYIHPFLEITKGFSTHLMFHELWLGAHIGASWKERLWGSIQRLFIIKFIRTLKPVSICTTNSVFQFLLKKHNVDSDVLSVFGNITLKENPDYKWIYQYIQRQNKNFTEETRLGFMLFLFFGNIKASTPFLPVLKKINTTVRKQSLRPIICHVGNIGAGKNEWNNLISEFKEQIDFIKFGELPENELSEILSFADFGLTAYPDILISKSGSVAAMREHNLPVIVSNYNLKIKGYDEDSSDKQGLIKLNSLEEAIDEGFKKPNQPYSHSAKTTAELFLKNISPQNPKVGL